MKELLKKKFQINVLWKVLEYDQLSYMEAIEFDDYMKKNKISIWEWAKTYLQQKLKLSDKELKKIDLLVFFDTYCDTALRWYYSKSNWDWGIPKSIPNSYIMRLSEKMSIDPITMLEKYTPEAIKYCTDWAIRNENAKSDKWRKENERKLQWMYIAQWDNEKDLEDIIAMREHKKALRLKKQQWQQ